MASNIPNIHLGVYKNYQIFHSLIFTGLSGKKKKRLKVRDCGQEEGEVSYKGTTSAARTIIHNHV